MDPAPTIANPTNPNPNPNPDPIPTPNEQASQKIHTLSLTKTVKGLKIPTKLTNLYHKKIKALQKMFNAINMEKIRTQGDCKIILVADDFGIEMVQDVQIGGKVEIVECQVVLGFNNLSNQEIFNMFQEDREGKDFVPFPNSFQTAGHIAHYNLTQPQHPFKHIIGQITLSKCPNIKTVVNKTQKLHNVYRTPILQHMAGQKNYEVRMKEVGVVFQFDFQKVYWCSRLQKERDRVLGYVGVGELVVDLFCGVGPLAVRAARKGAYVIANDLNPSCYEYLQKNTKINSVQSHLICWNMCARQATKKLFTEHLTYPKPFQYPDHIYMNLPVDAIQFLSEFTEYGKNMQTDKMPLVHVNCFVVADCDEKSRELLAERVGKVLGGFGKEEIVGLHHIKNVTVIMRMYCLTFRLRPFYDKIQHQQQPQNKPEQNNQPHQHEQEEQEICDKVQKKIKQK